MRILRGRLRCCPLLLSSLVISLVVFKENIFGPFPMLLYHAEFEIAACSPCENSTYILPVRNLTEFDKLFNSYRVYRKHVSMLKIRRTVAGHGHNLDNRCLSPPKTAGKFIFFEHLINFNTTLSWTKLFPIWLVK